MMSIPAADFQIDTELVRTLLAEQHPDLAHLPLELLANGWDNQIYRLGPALLVRLPRRAAAIDLLAKEQRWLAELAKRLPLPVPVPIRIGTPTSRYPSPWSVVPWLQGSAANAQPLRADQAAVLARFLKMLHVVASADAPRNPVRGVPLGDRAPVIEERLSRVARKTGLVTPTIRSLWEQGLRAPLDDEETWLHGDLHARNVLVDRGRISAVIDWGDMCRGDRATDLAAFWMMLPDARMRRTAMETYGPVPPLTWVRARGWAVGFGTVLLDTDDVQDPHFAMGRTIYRILEEGDG
jgi:aminoglycoside phosphotransferase (APT) family kinase protein